MISLLNCDRKYQHRINKKKIPDKQGEGRRIELRKKERERPERNRDRPSEREIAG